MTSSERAFDLYLKTRYTMQIHGHAQRGVVFATATPVANTMAEIEEWIAARKSSGTQAMRPGLTPLAVAGGARFSG